MADPQNSPRLSKTIEEIRAGLYSRIESVQDDYAAKGWLPARLNLNKGIARGLIELFAWGLWQLYAFLNRIHRQAIPLEATGAWLDTHASQVNEQRKPATKARGNVRFYRGTQAGNIRIPAGRIVRTLPDGRGEIFRYVTDTLTVLPEGDSSTLVAVTAEEYGQKANAGVGQICELVTPVAGIASVSNAEDWLIEEGADQESDASLQRRYVLAWQKQAGITRAAYEAAALSVPGVVAVVVADQHPRGEGTVDVVVQGAAGIPTEKLLEDVRTALASSIVINHDVLVKAPLPVPVSIKAELELLFGDEQETLLRAEQSVRAMFSSETDMSPRFGIGQDVVRDRLASALVLLPGVKRIRWDSPIEDTPVPADGLAVLSELSLSSVWVEQA